MAINDIKISQLPELAVATAATMFSALDNSSNYKVSMVTIGNYLVELLAGTEIIGEMSLTTVSPTQTFTGTAFTKILAFDKIQYERGIDIDLDNDAIIILGDKDYRVTVNINAEFNNNQGVEFAIMLDGLVAESLGTIQGRGNGKPVYIGGADIDPLTAGQVITLGAREDSGASVDIIFHKVRITVEGV